MTTDAGRFAAAAGRRRSAAAAPPVSPPRKYTVILDGQAADTFDETLLRLRRQLGRRVDRSQVIRELLALVAEDEALGAQVVDRLRD
ncbi:MAG: hypothetical protein ABJC62_13570 [Frankiaceae bacterium]